MSSDAFRKSIDAARGGPSGRTVDADAILDAALATEAAMLDEIERLRLRVEQLENGHDAWKIALPLIMADLAAERAECDDQVALVTAWRGVADGLYGSVDPDFMVGPAVAAYLDLRDGGGVS